ncbi:glycosyltransferase family 2 protein [Bacillus bombysepticus]|uniref:glycosyltransferase family 2 protein n=1 Tax=Bacillus bombysepticus TaxID=658666 RepID=UPI003019F8C7
MKLSLVMIVKNEQKHIKKCIQHAKKYVDEIIVVDTGSTDRTKTILSKLPVTLFEEEWDGHFANMRNKAIDKAAGDWILVLDADEIVTHFDYNAIRSFMIEPSIGIIRLKSKFEDEGITKEAINFVPRLFPRGVHFQGRIHEQLESDLPRRNVPIYANHFGYYRTNKSDRNIPLLLKALEDEPLQPYYHYQLGKEYAGVKNITEALNHFRLFYSNREDNKRYTKEGIVSFLYELKGEQLYEEMDMVITETISKMDHYADFHFIRGLFYMDYIQQNSSERFHLINLIEKSYLKCLEIGDKGLNDGVVGTGSFLAAFNLAVYYELMDGIIPHGKERAKQMYLLAAKYKYLPALQRLKTL